MFAARNAASGDAPLKPLKFLKPLGSGIALRISAIEPAISADFPERMLAARLLTVREPRFPVIKVRRHSRKDPDTGSEFEVHRWFTGKQLNSSALAGSLAQGGHGLPSTDSFTAFPPGGN